MSKKKRYSLNGASPVVPIVASFESDSNISSDVEDKRASVTSTFLDRHGELSRKDSFLRSNQTGKHSSFYRISSSDLSATNLSFDSLEVATTANVKIILIGDAGVGKTGMVLSFYNELPTKGQFKLMREVSGSAKENFQFDKMKLPKRSINANIKRLKKKPSLTSVKKRYSLNDYEELFNKKSPTSEDFDLSLNSNSGSKLKDEFHRDDVESENEDELVIDTSSTIGIDIKTTTVNVDNRFFKCITWDTAGQERYKNVMIPTLYKGSNGVFLIYDICDIESFRSCCDHWLQEAIDNMSKEDLSKARFYLIGNKIDLYKKRQVRHEDVLEKMSEIEFKFEVKIAGNFEVTCKWPNVVERTFNIAIKDLIEHGCYDDTEYKNTGSNIEKLPNKQSGDDDENRLVDSSILETNADTSKILKDLNDLDSDDNPAEERESEGEFSNNRIRKSPPISTKSKIISQSLEYNDMVSDSESDNEHTIRNRLVENPNKNIEKNDEGKDIDEALERLFPKKSSNVDITKPLGKNSETPNGSFYSSCCA
ncbi:hypothetical protein TPHA_0P01330 [Tetrapisispora phaffii CBS 4417]|uniref:GTP-binding protein YPT11 n=1 Tax=Tetrapisispora phaffii (strain ATCC 24235 / CBS 4417 / NBRC 1672 / NRRL Y-8282 / UCD 70-5) TaxID=1071381 RepID=G8C2B3_TETPH|nr:hypothetical protein TPHA_0P01330 [Tetrapisispora phaffii CBS 4417]CCE66291.1 hypothetical protein TPHA_0P01330 [Tetrapisispora phaffii CBS 4417]